ELDRERPLRDSVQCFPADRPAAAVRSLAAHTVPLTLSSGPHSPRTLPSSSRPHALSSDHASPLGQRMCRLAGGQATSFVAFRPGQGAPESAAAFFARL